MNKKKTKIKIKKSKINIYSKRKSKTRQTLTLVLTIAIACILAVVGYGIGKPIMKYFNDKNNSSETSSDPVSHDSSSGNFSNAEQSGSSVEDSSTATSESPDPELEQSGMYILPVETMASSETLSAAVTAAKEAGYTQIAVTLKDDRGVLYYKSEVERIKYISDINAGSLSAQQICDIVTKAGMTPAARISTFKDSIASNYFGCFTLADGVRWLDKAANNGGKPWLSPFEEEAVDYVSELTAELAAAGFKEIVCTNLMFPPFMGYDKDNWLSHLDLRNSEKRSEALWKAADKVRTAASSNGAKLWIEINGRNLLAESKEDLDAELAIDTEKFAELSVVVSYAPEGELSEIYNDAKTFAENIAAEVNCAEVVIIVDASLAETSLSDVKRAFAEAGFEKISVQV